LNLYIRFKNYFNISYLERETKKNNSLIYRALLKYGYSSFKLDILEYCDLVVVIEKEQYYLDNLKLEYNTLKVARYLPGFKHSAATIDRISAAKLVRDRDEAIKLKLSSNMQARTIIATKLSPRETKLFTSIRKTAEFMGMHPSYLAKWLKENKLYVGKGYSIVQNN
jgi:group I intron endonuclease